MIYIISYIIAAVIAISIAIACAASALLPIAIILMIIALFFIKELLRIVFYIAGASAIIALIFIAVFSA